MMTHHFIYQTAPDARPIVGSCIGDWDSYVTRFFRLFPTGKLTWTHDSCGGKVYLVAQE